MMLRQWKTIGAECLKNTMIERPVTTEGINWINKNPFWDLIEKGKTIDSILIQEQVFHKSNWFRFSIQFQTFFSHDIYWLKPIRETKLILISISILNSQKLRDRRILFCKKRQLRRNFKAGKQTLKPYAIVSLERLSRERYKYGSEWPGWPMFKSFIFC